MYRQYTESQMDTPKQYTPDDNAAVILLQYMTKEQLDEFHSSSGKVDAHINDLEQVKELKRDRENVIVRNKSLAEYNMSKQPILEDLKREVATGYEEVNNLKLSLGKDVAKLDAVPGSQSHDTMLAIFQTEVATSDDNAEELADEFCDGKVDVDTFISEYVQKRTDAYMKRAKLEKLGELFRQGTQMTSSVPYPSNNYAPKPHTQATSSVPSYGQPNYGAAGYGANSTPYPNNPYGGMPTPGYYQR